MEGVRSEAEWVDQGQYPLDLRKKRVRREMDVMRMEITVTGAIHAAVEHNEEEEEEEEEEREEEEREESGEEG